MKKQLIHSGLSFMLVILMIIAAGCSKKQGVSVSSRKSLTGNWKMMPSDKLVGVPDDQVLLNSFNDDSWYKAIVPGTVLGSLVSTGVVEDPYFGINMQKVDPDQFKQPWWYRTSFELTGEDLMKSVSLRFNGINYRADLYINGQKVAGNDIFAGAYKMFTFNIDKYKKEGKNIIALKIWQHADGEYSIGFVDWNPLPRDRSMGIFREVFLEINKGLT
jgi:exo-1,4-beta-D-glucosaminidase